jgi:hypothetical protein
METCFNGIPMLHQSSNLTPLVMMASVKSDLAMERTKVQDKDYDRFMKMLAFLVKFQQLVVKKDDSVRPLFAWLTLIAGAKGRR